MGAVAALIFMGFLFLAGIAIAVGSVIGTILFVKQKRRLGTVICVGVLVLGLVIAALPALFVGSILLQNMTHPKDFVETDIVIEENGYQDTTFTAAGVTYRVLDLEPRDACKDVAEPVFSYQEEGLLNRSRWGNYYRLKNSHGFDLIWDGNWRLFCPEDQVCEVMDYYQTCPLEWYVRCDEQESFLPSSARDAVESFLQTDFGVAEVCLQSGEYTELFVTARSQDGLVQRHALSLCMTADSVWLICECIYNPDGTILLTGAVFPMELARPILELVS